MKIFILILFCFLAIFFQSCEKSNPVEVAPDNISSITYIEECGMCQVFYQKLIISENQIYYLLKGSGSHQNNYKLYEKDTTFAISGILKEFEKTFSKDDFWKLQNSYVGDGSIADLAMFEIEVKGDDKQKKVSIEEGRMISTTHNLQEKFKGIKQELYLKMKE